MAEHKIKAKLPKVEIKRADAEFEIKRDGEKLGTLKVSKGDVEWVPAKQQYGYHVDWAEFADFMEEKGERKK